MSTLITVLLGIAALGLTALVTRREVRRWKEKKSESNRSKEE